MRFARARITGSEEVADGIIVGWDAEGHIVGLEIKYRESTYASPHISHDAGTVMTERLPDLLGPHLAVVFVGTAAGRRSAEVGAYYAGRGNRFWRTLHEVGITSRQYEPHEFRDLLAIGIGFTDIS